MLQIIALTIVGIGFFALIVWVNLYALDDETPDPGSVDTARHPVDSAALEPEDGSGEAGEDRGRG